MEENTEQTPSKELPDLQQSILAPGTLEQLFVDLAELTEITEIIPKAAAEGYVADYTQISLEEARGLLLSGSIRGLQIRYNYQGSQWWDTLLPAPNGEGFRIVRIEHNF